MASRYRQQHGQRRVKWHPASPARPAPPPLSEMTPEELRGWIVVTRAALEKKMACERAYLDRRAARGTFTQTDEACAADQVLEADIVTLLDEFEQHIAHLRQGGTPA